MMKLFRKNESGFSLVELMIVVAIIAILAAIAIPAFMQFAIKAKTSEATGNLNAIRTCEEAYRAENDVYIIAIVATPSNGGTDATPDSWTGGTADSIADFTQMGFAPDGDVRYQYEVQIGTTTLTQPLTLATNECIGAFEVTATGDIDEDTTAGTFVVDNGAAGYPKPVWNSEY